MWRLPAITLVVVAALAAAGCAGGRPQPALAKSAARDWAQRKLDPGTLQVTSDVVTPDETRARVRLKADGQEYDLRLAQPHGGWHVVSSSRG
jgi:hypothetical protein